MPLEFGPASLSDQPAIIELFAEAYQARADAPAFAPRFLEWKHFDPGPEWTGSRSYVLRDGNQIVAHAAVWPVSLRTPGGVVRAINRIEWAARKGWPGAGSTIALRFNDLAPVVFSTGGTKLTRLILPRIGYPKRGESPLYARVLRPLRQFRMRPGRKDWRTTLRLARNAVWCTDDVSPALGWTAHSASRPFHVETPFRDAVVSVRGFDTLAWLLRCPSMPVRLYELRHSSNARGLCLIAQYCGQARILDLRIESEKPDDWAGAFACATMAAKEDTEACEVVACGSLPVINRALERNGYRRRDDRPVWLSDPQQLLNPNAGMLLSFLDNDDGLLPIPESPFAT